MQIPGKITDDDFSDLARIVRSRWYWFKLLIANWYGIALLCAVAWATVGALIGAVHPNWSVLGLVWLVVIAVFAWAFYRAKGTTGKEVVRLNTSLPDSLSLANDGVKTTGPNGATSFLPWSSIVGLREGKRVMLLDKNGGTFLILPVGDLSQVQRDSIRSMVRSNIGPPNAVAAKI